MSAYPSIDLLLWHPAPVDGFVPGAFLVSARILRPPHPCRITKILFTRVFCVSASMASPSQGDRCDGWRRTPYSMRSRADALAGAVLQGNRRRNVCSGWPLHDKPVHDMSCTASGARGSMTAVEGRFRGVVSYAVSQ